MEARGVFTSDNLYNYATLPSDMRYKFTFDVNRWSEFYTWNSLPTQWDIENDDSYIGHHVGLDEVEKRKRKDADRKHMQEEID